MPHRIALTRGALTLAVLGWAAPGAADERVVWLREEGATATAPPGSVDVGATPADPEVDRSAEVAREALREARRLYLAYAFSDAAAALQLAGVRAHGSLVRVDRALGVELALWSGACALLADDREGSRAAFRRALALDPESRLPAGVFPPEVERSFEELRRAALVEGEAARTIRSAPAGARLEVDGRAEGATPVTVRLTPGLHHLRIERLGYRTWSGPLAVDAGGAGEREVFLAEATGADLRAQLRRAGGLAEVPDERTLERIRREYGVGAVVVARRDGTTLRYPAARPSAPVWPWVVGGAAAVAVGVGVLLYFVAQPESRFDVVAP